MQFESSIPSVSFQGLAVYLIGGDELLDARWCQATLPLRGESAPPLPGKLMPLHLNHFFHQGD